ncbi:MAG: hypothetical protein II925_03720, partial [Methanomicrobium sp.]|nr:hypothetical protein [Methanomicrobium sp.]
GIGPVSAKKICKMRAQKLRGRARKRDIGKGSAGVADTESRVSIAGNSGRAADNTDWSNIYDIIPARSLPYIRLREGGIQSRIGDYM